MRAMLKDVRRLVTVLVIVTFSIAALMGIFALLAGGDFGDTQLKVLGTTLLVGVESVAALCYLTVASRPTWWLGATGGAISVAASVVGLIMIWSSGEAADELGRTFGILCTLAASAAQACLLVGLSYRRTIDAVLFATLTAIAVLAAMIIAAITDGSDLTSTFWKAFGVVAILDVLGTVVLAALGGFGRAPTLPATSIDPQVWERATRLAHEHAIDPSSLVSEALDAYLKGPYSK